MCLKHMVQVSMKGCLREAESYLLTLEQIIIRPTILTVALIIKSQRQILGFNLKTRKAKQPSH